MTTLSRQLTPTRISGGKPLGRPPSMTDEECGTLFVRVLSPTPDSPYPRFLSRWTPSPAQRRAFAAGEDVYLSVLGDGHPPVMLYCGDSDGDDL